MRESKPQPPQAFLDVKSAFPEVTIAYEQLAEALRQSGSLSPRERELVKLGMAMGAGLESATKAHVRFALAAGLSADEITHAGLLGVTTLGWPSTMRALTWISDVTRKKKPSRRR